MMSRRTDPSEGLLEISTFSSLGEEERRECIRKIVVDSLAQCVERGEIQTAIRQGLLKKENIYAELSEIVLGRKPGRTTPTEITLFDATGMAVQDITTAFTVYKLALKRGLGVKVELG